MIFIGKINTNDGKGVFKGCVKTLFSIIIAVDRLSVRKGKRGRQDGERSILYLLALFAVRHWDAAGGAELFVYLLAYIALTAGIFLQMVKNARHFQFFDENFLMLLATIGAMVIGKYAEAVGAMLFFQIGKLIETVSMSQTKKSIAKYMDIRPDTANKKSGSGEAVVEPSELNIGDIIIIRPGEKIPVDAMVTAGVSTVDMKALTGEAEPEEVKIGTKLFSGSINLSGLLEARVMKVYAESTASRIMRLVEDANQKKSKKENFADRFTRYYTPFVTLLGILVMILPPMMMPSHDTEIWMYRGLIFLVAACPLGLLISVPLAFLGGIGAASKQGVMIKGSNYLEALSETETFIFDKTGTLTKGVFHVKEVCPRGGSEEELLEITAYAEAYSNHPIAVSLKEAYGKEIDMMRVQEAKEHLGYGVEALLDGRKVYIGNSKFMNKLGLYYHPVASVGSAVHVAVEGEYKGYILIADVMRKDAKRTVRWLNRHQLEVVMLTGDNERVAEDVAKQLGIESVYANLMPEDKVEQLEEFMESQMEQEKLAFIGDGINDAPVLARADVGIAMGGLGADAALEAADIILLEDEPSRIINAIRISRGTVRAVKQNLVFAIGMKVLLLIMAFFGYVTMQDAIVADMGIMLINILNSFWVIKYPE